MMPKPSQPSSPSQPWSVSPFERTFDAYFFLDGAPWYDDDWQITHLTSWPNVYPPQSLSCRLVDGSTISCPAGRTFDVCQRWLHEIRRRNASLQAPMRWHGETDQWAMAIDERTGIALLGVDHGIERDLQVLFADKVISPTVAAARLGLDPQVLAATYRPSPWFTSPNVDNPEWVKFVFAGHVEHEDDKLFYRPQFERFHQAMSGALDDFAYIRMLSAQALWRAVRKRPGGEMLRRTGTNAPVGGWQAFNRANCHKVATKFLTDNRHLQLRFENRDAEADALFPLDRGTLPSLQFFWLRALANQSAKPGIRG